MLGCENAVKYCRTSAVEYLLGGQMLRCARALKMRMLPTVMSYVITMFVLTGCGGHLSETKRDATFDDREATSTNIVSTLKKPILFQPMFIWATSETTYQGTGFFVRAPSNKIVAVTSGHFLNTDGSPLTEARWLEIRSERPMATFTSSWGPPGSEGTIQPIVDLRRDYLLMPAPGDVPADVVLELDRRETPDLGERIWFPNKTPRAELGYEAVEGMVVEADLKYSIVVLDGLIELVLQTGSPIISQKSGRVIGTLSRGGEPHEGKTVLFLAPASGILKALIEANEFPRLQDVIGKHKPCGKDGD